jgi:hypothetical protein
VRSRVQSSLTAPSIQLKLQDIAESKGFLFSFP